MSANEPHATGSRIDRLCGLLRCTLLPLAVRRTLQRDRVTILLYHRPTPDIFARHLSVLKKAYNLISLKSFVAALENASVPELPPRSLVLTFDDGHRSNFDLADALRTLPAPPTIFLCSGVVGTQEAFWFDVVPEPEALKSLPDEERLRALEAAAPAPRQGERAALSAEEIDRLKPHVDFESHTVSHPILPQCPDEKALREIADSRADLERSYGVHVRALAYPNGSYTEREVHYAERAGYRCALTVDPGFNGPAADAFRLKRFVINDDEDGDNVVLIKACGLWDAWRFMVRGRRQPAGSAKAGGP
jgi:peptidoglycan/xylan/chitin deacetylase (PgdA/CDA1 family)